MSSSQFLHTTKLRDKRDKEIHIWDPFASPVSVSMKIQFDPRKERFAGVANIVLADFGYVCAAIKFLC